MQERFGQAFEGMVRGAIAQKTGCAARDDILPIAPADFRASYEQALPLLGRSPWALASASDRYLPCLVFP
jgi:hypothetical protein